MNRKKKLNGRLQKIVKYYLNPNDLKIKNYTENDMAASKKSPTSTGTEKMINEDKSLQHLTVTNN